MIKRFFATDIELLVFFNFLEDGSPPEKSLRNIYLLEKQNPRATPSIGILYGDNKRKDSTSAVSLGHHSVFVKRAKHKFKNPFRSENESVNETEMASKSRLV